MQWRTICVCAVSLVAMTGCPEEFGKHGRINKAIHKDLMEQLRPKRCSDNDLKKYCSDGMSIDDCLEHCG